jgi:hypothetical protein
MADLFDKVKQGVDKGILIVSVRSKEAFDTVKLKSQIGDLRRRRRNALEDLGNAVYEMFRSDKSFDEEKIGAKCEMIAGLDGQIRGYEEQLMLIHIRAEETLSRPKALQKPKVVTVCECGAEIHEGVQFCGKCFRKIEYEEV